MSDRSKFMTRVTGLNEKSYLTVAELIEILKQHNQNEQAMIGVGVRLPDGRHDRLTPRWIQVFSGSVVLHLDD